jgi:uncharacterized protein YyaL (SSP411 family)
MPAPRLPWQVFPIIWHPSAALMAEIPVLPFDCTVQLRTVVPEKIVMLVADEASRKKLAGYLPVVETMTRLHGKASAYVCENYACKLPTADAAKFAELLQ